MPAGLAIIKPTSLLHFVHSKALYKAAQVTTAGMIQSPIAMAISPDSCKAYILRAARLSQAMRCIPKPKQPQPVPTNVNPLARLQALERIKNRSTTVANPGVTNSGRGTALCFNLITSRTIQRENNAAIVLKDAQGNIIKTIERTPVLCFE